MILPVLAAALLSGLSVPATAQHASHDRAVVGEAARGAQGRVAVNQAAGAGNHQVNLAAIAIAPAAPAALPLQQRAVAGDRGRAASAVIGAGAFAGGAGLMSVNQVAGSGNTQANLLATGPIGPIASVITGVDDAALAAIAGDPGTEGAVAPPALREAAIGTGAFAGTQGVVQVNQTAGVGNASVNAVVLQLPGGAR